MAEHIFTHSYLLLLLPLMSFVIIGLWLAGKYQKMAGQVAILLLRLSRHRPSQLPLVDQRRKKDIESTFPTRLSALSRS